MEKGIKSIKEKIKLSLNIKLVMVVVAGLLISTVLFFINLYIATALIQNIYLSEPAIKQRTLDNIEDFASYVSKNQIHSSDMSSIVKWQEDKKDVYILVYQNDQIIFDSTWWGSDADRRGIGKFVLTDRDTGEIMDSEASKRNALIDIKTNREGSEEKIEIITEEETETTTEAVHNEKKGENPPARLEVISTDISDLEDYAFYPVRFHDGIYDVCIVDYSESSVYEASLLGAFFISCLCCILIIALYNRKVIKRVVTLNKEVQFIETQDINGDISMKGQDEIYVLSDSINNMRNKIIEQLSHEKQAWQANRDLVTSMAHDIRTPLTVLSGYLELIKNKEYTSQEEMETYVDISTEKAMELKDLSDKLFRYFFVYSHADEKLEVEEYDAAELLQQLLGEYIILLEEKGFTFSVQDIDSEIKLRVDVQYLKRMFDNIFTNIRKYAEPSETVSIEADHHKDKLHIRIRNTISKNRHTAESTRIGMKTCQKIADQMGIRFWVVEKNMHYTVHLEFSHIQ